MTGFEGLGVFYLGRPYDPVQKAGIDTPLLYDSRDLLTHAVCVGMTGSGKTGLCVSLIEEAAIDGIPALVIDPKGDLSNLLLTFPELRPDDFSPWINPDDAARKGISPADHAAQQAQLWRDGLAKWGQTGERIAMLRQAADFRIYTPGSTAGLPVSVLRSFDPPEQSGSWDREALRERIQATVTALLALAGMPADPMQSREHILLSTILDAAWRQGKSLDLGSLIQQIPSPPFDKIGVLDLESFYPAKERFGLAMVINNLLAAPGFEVWMEGEPLDVANMLHTRDGRPRISIFSIAHLSDAERMFFVSLLLNQTVSWMRTQQGTTSLRALLYMDEIFGYLPPTANPPSKQPLMTLLKQARALGLGVVLATQNPVDLDYKALSNAGTWFIGRLQTERDQQRVLDGLEGAAASADGRFDRKRMEQTMAGLGSRIFLMNNVHDDEPVIFESRWALSYLRGPLTRAQIRQLMDGQKADGAHAVQAPARSARQNSNRPVLPPDIEERFLPARGTPAHVSYEPVLLGAAQILFQDTKRGVNETREVVFTTPIRCGAATVNWEEAEAAEVGLDELESEPEDGASYAELPGEASRAANHKTWTKDFINWLYATQEVTLYRSPSLGEVSKPGESERDFRLHLGQKAREQRDAEVAKLRQYYAPKIASLEERMHRAEQALEKEKEQASGQKMNSAISIGTSLLGAFFGGGRRRSFGGVSTGARSLTRSYKESQDVDRAEENLEELTEQRTELEQELEGKVAAMQACADQSLEALESVAVRPKKTNIQVRLVCLAWRA